MLDLLVILDDYVNSWTRQHKHWHKLHMEHDQELAEGMAAGYRKCAEDLCDVLEKYRTHLEINQGT